MIGSQTGNPSDVTPLTTPTSDPQKSKSHTHLNPSPQAGWRQWIGRHQSLILMPFVILGGILLWELLVPC